MDLGDVMDEVAARLTTIEPLRAFAWPQSAIVPPAAIVGYPENITYDATYGRGMDRMTLPVVVVVGKATERTARDRLAQYVNGSGAASFKAVLEAEPHTAFDTLRVVDADFDVYQISGTDYVAAIFNLDIAGQGA